MRSLIISCTSNNFGATTNCVTNDLDNFNFLIITGGGRFACRSINNNSIVARGDKVRG
jgi:hypothetical protein